MYNNNFGLYGYGGRQPYYLPVNYQQAMIQQQNQQMMQQPIMQQTQQPVQPQFDTPISDIRFLTEDQIKGFIVYPNTKVLLIDKQNGLAYLESADSVGNFYKDVFSFKNVTEKPKVEEKVEPKKNELDGLATKDDLNLLLAEIKALKERNNPRQNNLSNQQQKPNFDGKNQAEKGV